MELNQAISMLSDSELDLSGKETWIDLGCGRGIFTLAMAALLGPGSTLYAMDKSEQDLNNLPDKYGSTSIIKIHGDFLKNTWPANLNGILMANALHFVRDKKMFIKDAKSHLAANGYFVIVEYEMQKPSAWVPYPLVLASAVELFRYAGFTSVKKLNERPSVFNRALMYSAMIKPGR